MEGVHAALCSVSAVLSRALWGRWRGEVRREGVGGGSRGIILTQVEVAARVRLSHQPPCSQAGLPGTTPHAEAPQTCKVPVVFTVKPGCYHTGSFNYLHLLPML